MYHAVYAVITLFTSILESPSDTKAQVDLSLIAGFVRAVENLRLQHGCDLENLSHGCARIVEVAQNVVDLHGATSKDQCSPANTQPGRLTDREYLVSKHRNLHPIECISYIKYKL